MKKLFLLLLFIPFVFSCSKDPVIYTLTTSANPSEGGTVSPSTQQYDEGETASITATASSEYVFQSWSGATGSTNSTSVVMNSDKSVTANFVKKKYSLNVMVEGEGTVNEKVIKAGAATDYNSGTIVELTAVPSGEWLFVEWTGDVTGTENPTQITIDKAKNVTAVFVKKQYALTVEIEGEGTVTEKVIKAGVATDYNSGTIVELTAEPTGDWEFVEWTGDITSTENPVQITIDEAKTVKAVFVKKQYALTIEIEGEGTVAEKVIKAGAATDYNSGTIVELTATPKDGWRFKEWTGDLESTNNPVEITIDKAKTVKALFDNSPPFYLDENGVTIKARDGVTAGTKSELNGVTYTAVDNTTLKSMLVNEEDVTKVVTTTVTDMSNFFGGVNLYYVEDFNQDISSWDVSNVTSMQGMFSDASKFNQDISNWDVSNVTSMQGMFYRAKDFNQDIGRWDVSSVINGTYMSNMFNTATSFNQDLTKWCVTKMPFEPQNFSIDSPLTEENKPFWGICGDIYSYKIDVTSSSNIDYTLTGKDRNMSDGNYSRNDPDLVFEIGDTVTFSINAPGHPFYLKTAAGTGTGNQISGVTNNGTTNGNIVWTPSEAGTYYYQCSVHSEMGNVIAIEK